MRLRNKTYLILAAVLFLTEILIALFLHDSFIRLFIGDVLVIILIYCTLRIFLRIEYWRAAIGVLLFACCIEILQYFDYVAILGLEKYRILSIAMGRTFEWTDFGAYYTGFLPIILSERAAEKRGYLSGE